jgi:hypothetical protein
VGLQNVEHEEEKTEIAIKEIERMGFASKGDSVVIVYVDKRGDKKVANFKIADV